MKEGNSKGHSFPKASNWEIHFKFKLSVKGLVNSDQIENLKSLGFKLLTLK